MEMKWPPNILDGLFCDNKDHNGLYYWYDTVIEKKKFSQLKKDQSMNVTYEHLQ